MRFKKYLNETKNSEIYKKFGMYLFGQFQGKEDDTEYEKKIFELLKTFLAGDYDRKEKSKEFMNSLIELQKLKNKFPILRPETNNLKRIVILQPSEHIYILKQIKFEDENMYYSNNDATYKPHNKITSWTNDINYFIKSSNPKNYFVVESKFNKKELLFSMKFLNSLGKSVSVPPENEIIRMSNDIVKGKIVILKDDKINGKIIDMLHNIVKDLKWVGKSKKL